MRSIGTLIALLLASSCAREHWQRLQNASPQVTRPAYERACAHRDAEACFRLGYLYTRWPLRFVEFSPFYGAAASSDENHGIPPDLDRARALFEKACKGGSYHGCAALARFAPSWCGNGSLGHPERDSRIDRSALYQRTVDLARLSCDRGVADACLELAALYDSSLVTGRPEEMLALYQRACRAGKATACEIVREKNTRAAGAEPSEVAAGMFARLCDDRNGFACRELGWLHVRGEGVPQDVPRSVTLFDRACNLGVAKACGDLAWLLTRGEGITKDVEAGTRLRKRACALGDETECSR